MRTGQWLKAQQPSSRSQDYPHHLRAVGELWPLIEATESRTAADLGSGEPISGIEALLEGHGMTVTSVDLCALADVRAELGYLPFKDDAFGVAVARHSLEHSPAPLLALREMARVASWSLVVVPEMALLWQYWRGHFSVFPRSVWERLFHVADLRVVFFGEGDFTEPNANAKRTEWRWLLYRDRSDEEPYESNGRFMGIYPSPMVVGWQ